MKAWWRGSPWKKPKSFEARGIVSFSFPVHQAGLGFKNYNCLELGNLGIRGQD
jgi:hypothetical protein